MADANSVVQTVANTLSVATTTVATAVTSAPVKGAIQTGEQFALDSIDSGANAVAKQFDLPVSVVVYALTAIATVATVLTIGGSSDIVLKLLMGLISTVLWIDSLKRLGL